jgi:hypothetical protein
MHREDRRQGTARYSRVREGIHNGTGEMEGEFAKVLKHTLTQSPGTNITTPAGVLVLNSALQLFGEGTPESAAHDATVTRHSTTTKSAFKHYTTRSTTVRHDLSCLGSNDRYLLDEKTVSLGKWLDTPKEKSGVLAIDAASDLRGRDQLLEFAVDGDGSDGRRTRLSASLPSAKVQARSGEEELGMAQMVEIRREEEAPKDSDSIEYMRYILMFRTRDVELGWKVR